MPAAAEAQEAHEDRQSPAPDSSPRKKEQPDQAAAAQAAAKTPLSPLKRALLVGAALLLVLGGLGYWYHGTYFEDTDDAQIDGYISSVSPRVGGTVTAVHVEDNQPV